MDEASKLRGNLAIADFAIKDYKAKITALEAENATLRHEKEQLRFTLEQFREYLKAVDAYIVQMDREAKAALERSDE